MGEAASLLRDRNFIKGPGHCPRVISILRLGFRFVRAFTRGVGFRHLWVPRSRSLGAVLAAGNPGRNDLDETQELYYPAILNAIRETSYSGYISHEFIPKANPVMALQAAYRHCAPHL